MITAEEINLQKLASSKAAFVNEVFGGEKESILQVQAFAEQVLQEVPETMVVDKYLTTFSHWDWDGEGSESWDHSVWFMPSFGSGEVPSVNSSLDNLLDRSALMDVAFRGMQRYHSLIHNSLIYLASLGDPSGVASDIVMQTYPAESIEDSGFTKFYDKCNSWFPDYDDSDNLFDPRCRLWYQNAAESTSGNFILTTPYADSGSEIRMVTFAAPVFDSADPGLLLGVAGITAEMAGITESVTDLSVVEDEGYAYIITPGMSGELLVHPELLPFGGSQYIKDFEEAVTSEDFDEILDKMGASCSGSTTYLKNKETWLMAWEHETASSLSIPEGGVGCIGGFIVVVTVSKPALLQVFSKAESEIVAIVALASVIMAVILAVVGCFTGWSARMLSRSITEPVFQFVDVVQALNQRDFSRQAPGTWIVNDISSPEVEELMTAFEAMTSVVKFANITLGTGNIDVAQQNYIDALFLFKKLGNDRGVSIVHNNLGNVYTLQARKLAAQAAAEADRVQANIIMAKADDKFIDAVTSYGLAVVDAEMDCSEERQLYEEPILTSPGNSDDSGSNGEKSYQIPLQADDIEAMRRASILSQNQADDGLSLASALSLQLGNRKFNLALCLAAKVNSAVLMGGQLDSNALEKARELMYDCVKLAAARKDAEGDQRHVECLLELAKLERDLPNRQREAGEALGAADQVVIDYRGAVQVGGASRGYIAGNGAVAPAAEGANIPAPHCVLRQQVMAARGAHFVAVGSVDSAITCWTEAIINCGDRMDMSAVKSSLLGLRKEADQGNGGRFSEELLVVLGLPTTENGSSGLNQRTLVIALDAALLKLGAEEKKHTVPIGEIGPVVTNADLCFVMDCTRSMQSWIDQAKDKLFEIIVQAKKDIANLNLRVAFVGYRDFGDMVQYEGPYDFHTEDELPNLFAKLKGIVASGGQDVPEDIAGGLKRAVELSWKSPIRLCILIADAPCHGSIYHGCRDNYPRGCPKGLNPSRLLYTLQFELGVDFYFIRITPITDKMISVFQNTVGAYTKRRKHSTRTALRGTTNTEPKFLIHDLGSNNNRFLEAIVQSVKVSAGINLRVEPY